MHDTILKLLKEKSMSLGDLGHRLATLDFKWKKGKLKTLVRSMPGISMDKFQIGTYWISLADETLMQSETMDIYVDGSCVFPGTGGWAARLPDGTIKTAGTIQTTPVRAELSAIALGLESSTGNVQIFTDSQESIYLLKNNGKATNKDIVEHIRSQPEGRRSKTTSVHNIGVALARYQKKKVLMADLDPQGNLTDSCGVEPYELTRSVYEVLDGKLEPGKAITSLEPGLDLLPANQNLAHADQGFSNRIGRENLLKKALQKTNSYDILLIDCPPALGLLTVNAFVASQYILVPVQAEYHVLAGFDHITNTLEEVRASGLNPDLQLLGVFVTFF
jgi:chromosome partitioning protein